MNDGNSTGIKQDKFRNSRFEYEEGTYNQQYGGVSVADSNTINGPWAENRGRRGPQDLRADNPFENGNLASWNRKTGWDEFYESRDRGDKKHGGSLLHHDDGGQRGRGPRGYARPDSRIMDDICESLTQDRELNASEVEVKVESGVVTLTGKVENRSMKRHAGSIVDEISGVKDIHNLLEIGK